MLILRRKGRELDERRVRRFIAESVIDEDGEEVVVLG